MSTSPHDIAQAAVAATIDALKREGHPHDGQTLMHLLSQAVQEHAGSLVVTIATPTGQSGAFASVVSAAIAKKTRKAVTIIDVADASLIGGAVISYGDERVDMSVSRTLDEAQFLLTRS